MPNGTNDDGHQKRSRSRTRGDDHATHYHPHAAAILDEQCQPDQEEADCVGAKSEASFPRRFRWLPRHQCPRAYSICVSGTCEDMFGWRRIPRSLDLLCFSEHVRIDTVPHIASRDARPFLLSLSDGPPVAIADGRRDRQQLPQYLSRVKCEISRLTHASFLSNDLDEIADRDAANASPVWLIGADENDAPSRVHRTKRHVSS
jgi:hypothetical protein